MGDARPPSATLRSTLPCARQHAQSPAERLWDATAAPRAAPIRRVDQLQDRVSETQSATSGSRQPTVTTRRSRGDGSLFWHEGRRRQISAKTKTEAKAKLLHARRDRAAGLPEESRTYTVGDAV